jgi:hypothetical protein
MCTAYDALGQAEHRMARWRRGPGVMPLWVVLTVPIVAVVAAAGWYICLAALWVPWRDDPKLSPKERSRIKARVLTGYIGVVVLCTVIAVSIVLAWPQ